MDSGQFSWILGDSSLSMKDKVWILREIDSELPAIEISRLVDRSRERIRQILTGLGLETDVVRKLGHKRIVRTRCLVCGKDTGSRVAKCCSRECWREIYGAETWSFYCPNCGNFKTIRESARRIFKSRGHNNIYCSRPCFYEFRIGWTHTDVAIFRKLWRESA